MKTPDIHGMGAASSPGQIRTIYKYVLDVYNQQSTETAGLIRVIHVAPVKENERYVQVWAIVDPEKAQTTDFRVIGTGHIIAGEVYCGTAVTDVGLVWHVFVPYEQIAESPYMMA